MTFPVLSFDQAAEADRTRNQANEEASRVLAESQARRQQLENEFNERKAALDAEVAARRDDLTRTLEEERSQLESRVAGLRAFESNYRDAVRAHLNELLQHLDGAVLEPGDKPELLDAEAGSSTPRLDALLRNDN